RGRGRFSPRVRPGPRYGIRWQDVDPSQPNCTLQHGILPKRGRDHSGPQDHCGLRTSRKSSQGRGPTGRPHGRAHACRHGAAYGRDRGRRLGALVAKLASANLSIVATSAVVGATRFKLASMVGRPYAILMSASLRTGSKRASRWAPDQSSRWPKSWRNSVNRLTKLRYKDRAPTIAVRAAVSPSMPPKIYSFFSR